MNRFRVCLSLLALVALGLFGCHSLENLNAGFSATVASFHPTDSVKPEDGGMITLRFANETVASLGFSHSEHKLYLDDTLVANIANDSPFGIVTVSEITRDLPVHFEKSDFVRHLAHRGPGIVRYRLESRLYQKLGDDRNEMKLTSEGTLDLHGTAAAESK